MSSKASIRSILIPTDFSDEAQVAFAHALRLAVALGAELDVLHVEPKNDQPDWRWGPHVRETLTRWGYLKEGATEEDVAKLGIRVRKSLASGVSAGQAILDEVARSHADLIVMATHGRTGIEAWLQPSVTAPVALKAAVPVLVIPHLSRGFVDAATGGPSLNRILVPVDVRPHPAPAFDAAAILARALPSERLTIATLHVGPGTVETDWVRAEPSWNFLHWKSEVGVVESIEDTARTWSADLVVCVTEGRQGVLDSVRGSTVERLSKSLVAPLLIVPNEWGTDQIGTH